jgi:hypothetical protein
MYNRTGYSRGIITNLSDAPNILDPQTGETVFCLENNRVLTYDGALWMCDDFIRLTNSSAGNRSVGDVMLFSSTTSLGATIAATAGSPLFAGVVVYASTNGSPVALAHKGIYKVKLTLLSVTPVRIGYFIRSSSTGTAGAQLSTTMSVGMFGWSLEIPSGVGLCRVLLRGKTEIL